MARKIRIEITVDAALSATEAMGNACDRMQGASSAQVAALRAEMLMHKREIQKAVQDALRPEKKVG